MDNSRFVGRYVMVMEYGDPHWYHVVGSYPDYLVCNNEQEERKRIDVNDIEITQDDCPW